MPGMFGLKLCGSHLDCPRLIDDRLKFRHSPPDGLPLSIAAKLFAKS